MLVDNPILTSPFEEPTRYWAYEEGQPILKEGRRAAGYYLKARTRGPQLALLEEEFVPLELVNTLRERVKGWRERGYPGVTPITRQLLNHWNNPERERKLFFCQREAAEALVWLVEASPAEKQGIVVPKDDELTRYACKMATGSGKTVVMGMVIAWQVLNKLANPQDRRFCDAVLIVCPNLTIKERLQVLLPWKPGNYYEKFDLVPPGMLERLQQGKFQITNWHLFQPKDDSRSKSVVQRGPESDAAFCRRVLKELGSKQNILVINDEAHHAYRPAPLPDELRQQLSPEEIAEREEATLWVSGLDRIHAERGINFCADFSATPFYIKGSGYEEGAPFPWVVSDFGLVDAIESGIVKVPRVPVDDNTGELIPRYFRLWEWINSQLPASERQTVRRRAKPESVLREAQDALATLASEWKRTFEEFRKADSPVPPVLIVVCDNTDLAKLVHEHIAKGNVLAELENRDGQPEVTFRIDTKLLAEAEAAVEGETKQEAAERLRKVVDTVGKTEWEGDGEPPGKPIRCIVSVGMLNEGWDAQNVTQILGLRAFTSQLLCEQVVGRGLRRLNYDDFTEPEYVDVYGVPFEVIPVKKKAVSRTEVPKVSTLVRALPERKHLEITFPRVEGYVFDVRSRLRVDWDGVPYLVISPTKAPTEVMVKPAVGYRLGRPDRLGPGPEVLHDRNPFHREKRLQATVYELAAEITGRLKEKRQDCAARHVLFPQVLRIVWEYLEKRVVLEEDTVLEEVALLKYRQQIVERLMEAIEPDVEAGEPPLLPVIERFRPIGSTSEVLFRTVRPTVGTTKSHISHVVLDAPKWEHTVAFQLERMPEVISYARNDHLDFTISYEWQGVRHEYRPDYLIRLRQPGDSELKVILEVKGLETEQDRQKEAAARRWVIAVNHHRELGQWAFAVCREPARLQGILRDVKARAG
ncbi:DNA/RNA helicase, superfamily II [Chthonomonas calidirosea]|uniref:DNA or RNA helicases of superfamily II n=1 Tax=Chthonomonas calidirosea (strain DSM 23976 / ICMP 18418 / T49) TaxID=1303518 RepID=S0ES56_CHTCT|nr:DEAD/DEAH box helicase family protein [Chthonomonas calidirosea]CCW33858.1 DNA or RNA helicases of superfamily II [Chthonomonas calidirosea T49]CEK16453.1 DNA/RNA helicase, superfamily II [Chthonomonas calidirosea]